MQIRKWRQARSTVESLFKERESGTLRQRGLEDLFGLVQKEEMERNLFLPFKCKHGDIHSLKE